METTENITVRKNRLLESSLCVNTVHLKQLLTVLDQSPLARLQLSSTNRCKLKEEYPVLTVEKFLKNVI